MKTLKIISLLFLLSILLSCSKSEENKEEEHFLSGQQRSLEKAQGVEDMLQESEEKRRKQAEEAAN